MIKERRQYIRIAAGIDFTYKLKNIKSIRKKATTTNISPSGIRAIVDKKLKTGDWIDLGINLPGKKPTIFAVGKVIWITPKRPNKTEVGIKFEEIAPDKKNKFLEYICELMFSELERLR